MIKGLITLLAGSAAVAAAIFFWSRNRRARSSLWHKAVDTTSSLGKDAVEKAGDATDKVAAVAGKAAGAVSGAV